MHYHKAFQTLLLAMGLCSLLGATAHATLLGLYTFDDSLNTLKDDSGKGATLTQVGGAANPAYSSVGGFSGGGFSFDGGDRLIAPININPGVRPQLTIGAWVRISAIDGQTRKIIGHDDNGGDRTLGLDNRLNDFASGGTLRYSAFTGTGGPAGSGGLVETPPAQFAPVNTTDWTFVAVAYSQTASRATVVADLNAATTGDALAAFSKTPTALGTGNIQAAIGGLRPDNASEAWLGSIDNVFFFNEALTASQLSLIRTRGPEVLKFAAPKSNELWSVDIQAAQSGGSFSSQPPNTFSGVESNYGYGAFWNALNVPTFNLVAPAPVAPLSLKDSAGANSSVVLTVSGNVLGYNNAANGAQPLTGDFMFFNAQGVPSTVDIALSGLAANSLYEMVNYSSTFQTLLITLDTNGDGLLTDEIAQTVTSTGLVSSLLISSSTGRIIGRLSSAGPEGNWAGFQLRLLEVAAPEPGTWLMMSFGFVALAWRRRVRGSR